MCHIRDNKGNMSTTRRDVNAIPWNFDGALSPRCWVGEWFYHKCLDDILLAWLKHVPEKEID